VKPDRHIERWRRLRLARQLSPQPVDLAEAIRRLREVYGEMRTERPTEQIALDSRELRYGRYVEIAIYLRDLDSSVEIVCCEDQQRYVAIPALLAELDRLRQQQKGKKKAA
jgi:hypothetical protein